MVLIPLIRLFSSFTYFPLCKLFSSLSLGVSGKFRLRRRLVVTAPELILFLLNYRQLLAKVD